MGLATSLATMLPTVVSQAVPEPTNQRVGPKMGQNQNHSGKNYKGYVDCSIVNLKTELNKLTKLVSD